MKDFLALTHDNMQEGDLESATSTQVQQLPDQNSNEPSFNGQLSNLQNQWSTFEPVHSNVGNGQLTDCKPRVQDVQAMLQELNNRRTRILIDIANEEKERQWFLAQLEKARQQQQQQKLPLPDNYGVRSDMSSRELELEVVQLREAMQRKLGSGSEILQRHEVRMQSLQLIDKEALQLQEQAQLIGNRQCFSRIEDGPPPLSEARNGSTGSLQDLELSELLSNCPSPPATGKSSKMTTSSTQTTIDLYPTDYSSNNAADGNGLSSIYHGTWPMDKVGLWNSGPSSFGEMNSSLLLGNQETRSVMSFTSSMNSTSSRRSHNQQLGTKVEMVYSLLSMLGSHDKDEMSKTLLDMSSSRDSCVAMRQSGCMPLLIQLLHVAEKDSGDDCRSNREARSRASKALHNIVHAHPDDKRGRREARVLRLLEQIRDYCDNLRDGAEVGSDEERTTASGTSNMEQHPGPSMAALMKLSFDEEHRHAMCQLGGLQAIAELIEVDYSLHGNTSDQYCVTLRRYAGMALTNLTFGDGTNKAMLCSMKSFMTALVAQLHSPSEDLRQVVASVLRNLSWRADPASKKILREVGAVVTLMKAAMEAKKESTLKSILSALWNLSAHCSMNKADICAVDGALAFLVSTLTYKSASKTLAIIENGGGILRNISSQIAEREDYRAVLRQHNCLQILLQHLRSSSLTIVSNACGTLWNLSARSCSDQQALWEMGAVSMLRNLVHSKHKMISMGSSAALKNLLTARPNGMALAAVTSPASGDGHSKSALPSLLVRKQRALEAEIDQNLSETCDNIDSPKSSPTHRTDPDLRCVVEPHSHYPLFDRMQLLHGRMYQSANGPAVSPKRVGRSESKDSINSSQSDTSYDRLHGSPLHHPNAVYPVEQPQYPLEVPKAGVGLYNNLGRNRMSDSHITHIIQEVGRHVAAEESSKGAKSEFGSHYSSMGIHFPENSSDNRLCADNNSSQTRPSSGLHNPHVYDKYSNLTNKIENLNTSEHQDNIKCSMKYGGNSEQQRERLPPKIDNYVSSNMQKEKAAQKDPVKQFPPTKQTNQQWQGINNSRSSAVYYKSSNIADETNVNPDAMFNTYAETDLDDLDQPTNFSLRYTEDTDSSDKFTPPVPESHYYPATFEDKKPSVNDDAVKTYCTEGTPLNFSTASSLTDLRDLSNKEKLLLEANRDSQKTTKDGNRQRETQCENSDSNVVPKPSPPKVLRDSNRTDGMMSLDKPAAYCVEDTPLCFSHASSISSLHSSDANDHPNASQSPQRKVKEELLEGESCAKSDELKEKAVTEDHLLYRDKFARNQTNRRESVPSDNKMSHEKEGKSVSFGEGNVAEETPLMFSRCSSLGSLSSFEQHSIHDDRSSVVSDFSRRASGAVSPSDLPDSPSQTMPPSPRRTSHKMDFPASKSADDKANDIFSDSVQTYQLEDTPIEFSTATSLSSLAIDDDCPVGSNDLVSVSQTIQEEKEDTDGSKENLKMEKSEPSSKSDDSPCSPDDHQDSDHQDFSEPEENEEEDDILAACINSAMPNNSKHNKRMYNNTKLSSKVNRFVGPPRTRSSGIPVKTNNIRVIRPPLNAATSLIPERDPQANERHAVRDKNLSSGIPNNQRSDCNLQDDLLLKKTIDSAMPKGRPRKHNNTSNNNNLSCTQREKNSTTKSHLGRPSSGNTNNKNGSSCLGDSVKVYAVEGTPINFSSSSSISGLTFESNDEHPKGKETLKDNFREPPIGSSDKILDFDDATGEGDSFRHYAEEGTPFTISRHDSLSSLSCCTENSDHHSRERDEKKRSHRDNMLYRIPGKYNSGGNGARSHSLPVMRPPVRPPAVGQSSGPSPSLLRQNTLPLATANTVAQSSDLPSSDLPSSNFERHKVFQVEDTPVCFSRNSSLSSLSVESLGTETSLAEQALLDECISSAMPETKSVEKKVKAHHKKGTGKACEKPVPKKANGHQKHDKPFGNQEEKSSAAPRSQIPRSVVSDFAAYSETSHESDVSEGYEESTVTDSSLFTDTTLCATVSTKSDTTLKAELSDDRTNAKEEESRIQPENTGSKKDTDEALVLDSATRQIEQIMMNSKLLELEASNVIVAVRREADNVPDSMVQSAASGYSDLENMKPPSILGDVMSLTCSMVSSCASDSMSELKLLSESEAKIPRPVDGPSHNSSKRMGSSLSRSFEHSKLKNIPELVLRALNGNPDTTKACASSEGVDSSRPPSGMDSVENLSMRSSCVSDLENIKPPSALDDIDMTCSTNSVASITSEVAEGKSEPFSLKGSVNSEMMLECMKPVIAMVELYAREGMNAGSMKSSCNSEFVENIENINPPSIFQEFTECNSTINDITATLGSDTDTDDDLPEDHITDQTKTLLPNADPSANPELDEEEPVEDGGESILDITPEEVQALEENAKLIVSTLIECKQNVSNDESSLTEDVFIECETLSLVSNDSDSSQASSHHSNDASADTLVVRRPRIVKPVSGDPFRDVVRPVDNDNGPKPIRGKRRSVTKCRQPTAIPVQRQIRPARSASPKLRETPVKPTRTSALRATQSQQKVHSPPRSMENNTITSPKKVSPLRTPNNSMSPIRIGRSKTTTPRAVVTPMGKQQPTLQKNSSNKEESLERVKDNENCIDDNRPKPPIKQGTFTKDKPSQDSPPKISPSKIKPPSVIGRGSNEGKPPTPRTTPSSDCKENSPITRTIAMRSRMNQSRSLDDRPTASRYASYSPRTPSVGAPGRIVNGRIQTPSPMNRKVSNSLNNLKRGQSASSIKSSPSNQSLVSTQASGRRTPNSGLSSRSGSGTLNTGKRSTSNLSLCSNNSTNTTASTVTNASSKKGQGASPLKKEVVSKVAALWKKDNDRLPKASSDNQSSKVSCKSSKESTIPRPLGLSRSSTYEKLPNSDTSLERTQQSGIRLEDKNQHNNKTFTKSPSVDSKLGSLASNDSQDNRTAAEQDDVWVKRPNTSRISPPASENAVGKDEKIHQLSPKHLPRPTTFASNLPDSQDSPEIKTEKVLGFRHDTKASPASAIVPPFNYTPSATRSSNQPPVKSLIPTPTKTVPAPVKRQDSYLKSIEPKSPGEPKRNTCMITTV